MQQLGQYRARTEQQLAARLERDSIAPRLQQAMRYALLDGGKRVRPCLVYLVNQLLGGKLTDADPAACALECIHSYSLVHDDLPAMDDDALRRGQPTCHIQFDEATAILAGDALLTLAFELISDAAYPLPAEQKLQMTRQLAIAAGDRGMIAGQMFDIQHEGQMLTLDQLQQMHHHKTGALLSVAIELGALSSGQVEPNQLEALRRYGRAIGLAFQVKDDILDIEGDTETLGKPQGSDQAANKPTYPALLGLDGARQKLHQLHQTALDALREFGPQADALRALADYIVERNH
ncbi:polyprenyl synthetase family protein [Marinobacterium arenosum]|uniref:polyprenyl synthetase family protein n=1 Tax=Marinobacterium arenosum TaxID=2862496 RepID=UPI001C9833FA|nr:farnesyl diphosphate synthase [Marinobacterium arenosum]MBY4675536.1 polyprenyl synthetase family protein [Marinobacterium arenosum]